MSLDRESKWMRGNPFEMCVVVVVVVGQQFRASLAHCNIGRRRILNKCIWIIHLNMCSISKHQKRISGWRAIGISFSFYIDTHTHTHDFRIMTISLNINWIFNFYLVNWNDLVVWLLSMTMTTIKYYSIRKCLAFVRLDLYNLVGSAFFFSFLVFNWIAWHFHRMS